MKAPTGDRGIYRHKAPVQDANLANEGAKLHVFMRGVMWRSAELDSARVWTQLSQSWATPFCPEQLARFKPGSIGGASQEQIMSHKGITDMAEELYGIIWEHLKAHQGPPSALHEVKQSQVSLARHTAAELTVSLARHTVAELMVPLARHTTAELTVSGYFFIANEAMAWILF